MSKSIIICLDGTGNQYGEDISNVVRLYRMLQRDPRQQIAYYDPGVGTMGDPTYKTWIARKTNKVLGLAFGRGLTKNLVEAYSYLIENYEDGDRVFLFGFSRGAYTARALAGFIRSCGLFERGTQNMIPYAMGLFLKRRSTSEPEKYFKILSGFRSTYGRRFRKDEDPKYPRRKVKSDEDPFHWQLRIHFMGLFDTVKSYGWVRKPITLRSESKNPSVLKVRHALAIDERRLFFRQLHWDSSPGQDCKEVWFPGVHSDIGGGYPERESGLAKGALEWMLHEACASGLKVDPYRYGQILGKSCNEEGAWTPDENPDYSSPDAEAPAHESLKGLWRAVQVVPKQLEAWEADRSSRTIVDPEDREATSKGQENPFRVHESVFERRKLDQVETIGTERTKAPYQPSNLPEVREDRLERTLPETAVFGTE